MSLIASAVRVRSIPLALRRRPRHAMCGSGGQQFTHTFSTTTTTTSTTTTTAAAEGSASSSSSSSSSSAASSSSPSLSSRLAKLSPQNVAAFVMDTPQKIYDNLGILTFLSVVTGIVGMIYRTFAESSNRTAQVEKLEAEAVLELGEVVDLIERNATALTPATFAGISRSLAGAFPTGRAAYPTFVAHVQGYLEAPLQRGHLLDRVILARRAASTATGQREEGEDVRFLMLLLALALDTESLEERAKCVFRMLAEAPRPGGGDPTHAAAALGDYGSSGDVVGGDVVGGDIGGGDIGGGDIGGSGGGGGGAGRSLEPAEVAEAVDFLYESCQTPPERRAIKGDRAYPSQTYKAATSTELLEEAALELKVPADELISEDEFVDMMFTKAICAWGSCYPRRF